MFSLRCMALCVISAVMWCNIVGPKKIALQNDHEVLEKGKNR